MLKTLLKSGILGGAVLFIWNAISWMVLPWHLTTMHAFKNEALVSQVITANAPVSGIYFMPLQPETVGPQLFTAVHLGTMASMNSAMLVQLIIQIAAAMLVTWLVMKTSNLSYWSKVLFVVVFALAAAIISHLSYWNWFAFETNYTLVEIADLVIGWFLAGLVIAKVAK